MWSQLFTKQPTDVFDVANDTMSSLNKLRDQRISNALKQIKLNYAPQMAQSAASKASAEASSAQNTAKYAPQMSLANLARIHAETSHENAMTDFAKAEKAKSYLQDEGIKSDNAIKAAEAQGAPEKVKNALQLQQAQIQMTYAKANAASNSAASNAIKTIPTKDRGRWLAAHPEYVAHLSKLSNQLSNGDNSSQATNAPPGNAAAPDNQDATPAAAPFNPMGNMSGQSDPNAAAPNAPLPQQQDASSNAAPPMIAAPQAQAQPQAQTPLPQIAPSAPQPQLSKADQTFQLGNQMEANKNAVSTQDTKKLGASIEIEKFLQNPELDTWAAAMAKYSGIAGKGKAYLEAWQKNNPEDYEKNLFGRNQFKSALINQNKNLEGLGVQVSQREELTDNVMQAFDQYSSNPKRAFDQWKRTKHMFHLISLANSVAAQPLYPGVREKAAGLSFDDHMDLNQMVSIKVNGKPASVPLKNLQKALQEPGVEMDLGD